MAKKHAAPVYPVAPLQEQESRWQCATCRGYLALSLPIGVKAMGQLLLTFSKAHERCAPAPGEQTPPASPSPRTRSSESAEQAESPAAPELAATAMSYDPEGPTAKAHARREVLLALPRQHTPAEKAELGRLEKKLIEAGVLSISTTF